jgi:hypothetical protein
VRLYYFPFHETISQPEDRIVDSGSNDFAIPSMRTMPLKLMIISVIGDNSFASMDVTAHLICNFLAYLDKLSLSSAIVFGKSRELTLAKEKCFAVVMSAPSRTRPVGKGESNEWLSDLCSGGGGRGIKQSEGGRDSAGVTQ